jgi:hypothetical protein
VAADTCHDVILDAHAAEPLQLLDALPLDELAERLRLRFVQKLVDEIEARRRPPAFE